MYFQCEQSTTFEAEQSVTINARPALGGVCLFVQLRGRATHYGIGALPLFGRMQFNASGSTLPWPVFELTRGYAQPSALRANSQEYFDYEGYLSHAQLEAFEKERNGKDFAVSVKASLRVLNQSGQIEDWFTQSASLNKTAQEWLASTM